VFQMSPLLLANSPTAALIAAGVCGALGSLCVPAAADLMIRCTPKGLEGATMMLWWAGYWIAYRFGDVLGAWVYGWPGGFATAVWVTCAIYALTLPLLLLVPKSVMNSKDGDVAQPL